MKITVTQLMAAMMLIEAVAIGGMWYNNYQWNQAYFDRAEHLDVTLQRAAFFSALDVNESVAGQYRPSEQMLWVSTESDAHTIFYDVNHEYGHYVFDKLLSKTEKDEWVEISNDSGLYVSDYAKTNTGEDFAETFANGISCSWNSVPIPAKDDFMRLSVVPKLEKRGVLQ